VAGTFAIFAKPDMVMKNILKRQRIGLCALFVRTISKRSVARRMASLKTGCIDIVDCTKKEIKFGLCGINNSIRRSVHEDSSFFK